MEDRHHTEAHGDTQGVVRLIFTTFLEHFLLFPTLFSLELRVARVEGSGIIVLLRESLFIAIFTVHQCL